MIRIGTSGWNYRHWRDSFYGGAPRRLWLSRMSTIFPAVEVNTTHYRTPKAETLEAWVAETTNDFVFTAKGHRVVTHSRRLKNARQSIARQRDALAPLAPKLAAVLWQLPASFTCDMDRIGAFLDALAAWPEVRHVMEFRNVACFTEDMAAALDRAGAGNVMSDAADWPIWDRMTAGIAYVRLHGHTRTYHSAYSDRLLARWAARIRAWEETGGDVFVFFDNDAEGAAPRDARRLMTRLGLAR